MGRVLAGLAAVLPAVLLALAPQPGIPADVAKAPAAPGSVPASAEAQRKFVSTYCVGCHNKGAKIGNLALDGLNWSDITADAETWEKVVRKVRAGMMPPAGMPRPDQKELLRFVTHAEGELDRIAVAHPNPGSPALHRLNRTEYANAIRDLLGIEVDVAAMLPGDDSSEGFDNIADVLSVSPSLIQGYVSAAMKLSRLSVGDRTMPPQRITYRAEPGLSQDEHIEGLPLGTRGGMVLTHNFPLDAEYEFQIAAGAGAPGLGGRAGGIPDRVVDVDVTVNGQPLKLTNTIRFSVPMKAGPQTLGVSLVDRVRPACVDDIYYVCGVGGGVQNIVIIGPNKPTGAGDTPSRRRIFICQPQNASKEEACAKKILAKLATRAYRRPIAENDAAMKPLMAAYAGGRKEGDFEIGIQHALARVLVDPRFLFRVESEPKGAGDGEPYRITDLELASRLSFFLWSSIPDDELLEVAAKNQLKKPAVLEKQVRRMLADPKSDALIENFAGQWLMLRELANAQPDVRDFDANLKRSMRKETELLFTSVLREDKSVVRLLDADYTYVDERLARHYGIPGIKGSYMRKIALPADSPRRGVLGHGSLLTVTSVADRTSPVTRGKWVVENLLGTPVPAPPAGVEQDLSKTAAMTGPSTLRTRLEMHRANPTCAACHAIMDPIGFSMEPFDLTGRLRDKDDGLPIDATGKLADGTALNGPVSLREALLARQDAYVSTLTQKLMTYALGRNLRYSDMPAVRAAARDAEANDNRLSALVLAIAKSAPFQMKTNAQHAPVSEPPVKVAATRSGGQSR